MISGTDEILDVLATAAEVDIRMTRQHVNDEIQRRYSDPPARSTIYRAFDRLAEKGYIRTNGDEKYWWITEKGQEYRRGERDAGED